MKISAMETDRANKGWDVDWSRDFKGFTMVTMATAVLYIRSARQKHNVRVWSDEKTSIFLDFAQGNKPKRHIRWEAATKCLFTFAFWLHHHVTLSSSAVVKDTWLENGAPPTAYPIELTPGICTTLVDGNSPQCGFSLAVFLKIWTQHVQKSATGVYQF